MGQAPFVVRVSGAPMQASPLEQFLCERSIVAEQQNRRGRHYVLEGRQGRHRLVIDPAPGTGTTAAIACNLDHDVLARLEAATALLKRLGTPSFLRPTPFQCHRLSILLSILDTIEQLGEENATTRRIASAAIYPGRDFGSALEWKTSSFRRQTQRLVAEARRMTKTGYRQMLAGQLPPKE